MIPVEVRRNGSQVEIKVTVNNGTGFVFAWNTGAEWSAMLLRDAVAVAIADRLETIRKQAYEDGWKDAKAKRARSQWFERGWWVR
jgi:hypothetical protein